MKKSDSKRITIQEISVQEMRIMGSKTLEWDS